MRILIADDHPIVRHGLKQFLSSEPELTVVGEATHGGELLELARRIEWDVALVDFTMPVRAGLELLADLKREFPERPVLVLSIHSERLHATSALKAGAAGYLTKESAPKELAEALRKVSQGGHYVSKSLGELLASEIVDPTHPHDSLSDREYRVMWLLASGKPINAIAKEMTISPSTVSTYRSRILTKLGLRNNAEIVRYALRHQLVADSLAASQQ